MATLPYLAKCLSPDEDDDIEYVEEESQKVGATENDYIGWETIYTKLKAYPYEFEINSDLQIASVNGQKVASKTSEKIKELEEENLRLEQEIDKLSLKISNLEQEKSELSVKNSQLEGKNTELNSTVNSLQEQLNNANIQNRNIIVDSFDVREHEADGYDTTVINITNSSTETRKYICHVRGWKQRAPKSSVSGSFTVTNGTKIDNNTFSVGPGQTATVSATVYVNASGDWKTRSVFIGHIE